jgi:hypothetical protein
MIKIKLICHWLNDKNIKKYWNKLSKGNCKWNNIQLTTNYNDADFFCIINHSKNKEKYDKNRTIYMTMEPKIHQQFHPVKWKNPNNYIYKLNRNNIEWHLNKTYNQLINENIIKTKVISGVISDKYKDNGHKKRIDFLKYIDNKLKYDLYGKSNNFNFKNYIGKLPLFIKDNGILPYKYTFAFENTDEKAYFTEKLIDGILGECLCFYWGCPNITDYIDKEAIIILDLDKKEESFNIINDTIKNNEWEKRIDIIKKEKNKILNELQFFPTLERIVNNIKNKKIKINNKPLERGKILQKRKILKKNRLIQRKRLLQKRKQLQKRRQR